MLMKHVLLIAFCLWVCLGIAINVCTCFSIHTFCVHWCLCICDMCGSEFLCLFMCASVYVCVCVCVCVPFCVTNSRYMLSCPITYFCEKFSPSSNNPSVFNFVRLWVKMCLLRLKLGAVSARICRFLNVTI